MNTEKATMSIKTLFYLIAIVVAIIVIGAAVISIMKHTGIS